MTPINHDYKNRGTSIQFIIVSHYRYMKNPSIFLFYVDAGRYQFYKHSQDVGVWRVKHKNN